MSTLLPIDQPIPQAVHFSSTPSHHNTASSSKERAQCRYPLLTRVVAVQCCRRRRPAGVSPSCLEQRNSTRVQKHRPPRTGRDEHRFVVLHREHPLLYRVHHHCKPTIARSEGFTRASGRAQSGRAQGSALACMRRCWLPKRRTTTSLVWPIRWQRSIACSSTAGFHQGSIRKTVLAAQRFSPTPPALSESRKICGPCALPDSPLKSASAADRLACEVEPSSRTYRTPRCFSGTSIRSRKLVHYGGAASRFSK